MRTKELNLDNLIAWYKNNLGQILFIFLILVFFTLTITYIPFLNLFISPNIGFGISIIAWYVLFMPSTKILTIVAVVFILIGFLSTAFLIGVLTEAISKLLFLLIIFIFISYIRE